MSSAVISLCMKMLDVVELADLREPVVDDPDPRRQPGKLRFPLDATAELAGRFGQLTS